MCADGKQSVRNAQEPYSPIPCLHCSRALDKRNHKAVTLAYQATTTITLLMICKAAGLVNHPPRTAEQMQGEAMQLWEKQHRAAKKEPDPYIGRIE